MNNIGSNIKKHRENKGFTQFHLAMELGISQSAYAQIESGITKISIERAISISQILMVELNELVKSPPNSSLKSSSQDLNKLKEMEEKINDLYIDFQIFKEQLKQVSEKLSHIGGYLKQSLK